MNKNQKIKLYLFLFLLVLAIVFAILFPRLTLPFGFSYIIYLMFRPFTTKLKSSTKRQRIFYITSILTCVTFLFFSLFVTFYTVDTDYSRLSNQLPEIERVLSEKFFQFKVNVFEKYGIRLNMDPVRFLMSKLEIVGAEILTQLPHYLSSLFEWLLLVPLFLYFFFLESGDFGKRILEAVPNPIFEKSFVLLSQFNTKFGEYIIAKFIEATILGVLVTAGLLIIGFPYPFILGFVAGITNILPYIGPVLGFIPAFLIALLSKDPNASMLAMSLIFLVANLVDMILVFPLIVSKIVNLHPIVVVVSVIIGSQLGGVIGMIVIIPFIAFFKLLFKEIYKDLSVSL